MTPTTTKSRSLLPMALSLAAVIVCLTAGGLFVWWEIANKGGVVIKLTPDELASLPGARNQPIGVTPAARAARRPNAASTPPPDPDGIFNSGNAMNIRTGNVQVRVSPGPVAGGPPVLVFAQRNWGMLQNSSNFTIARRVVHEDAIAKQLAVTPDQIAKLTPIVSGSAVKGVYVNALPVSKDDMTKALDAWMVYRKTWTVTGPPPGTPEDLLAAMKDVGNTAMAQARKEYSDADSAISGIITNEQIAAYINNRSLATPTGK